MDEKEVLGRAADTILQEPVRVEVDVIFAGKIERLLIKLGLRPAKRIFNMDPMVYAKGIRISKMLLDIDADAFRKADNLLAVTQKMYAEHGEALARIIATAVSDPRKEPPKSLVKFFLTNLTPKDGITIIGKIITQSDVASFMTTIISAKGMSLLKPEEKIAPGQSSEA